MKIVNQAKRVYPVAGETGKIKTNIELNHVLVEHPHGKLTCFAGVGDAEFVVECGVPLRYAEAVGHYPNLKEENYQK